MQTLNVALEYCYGIKKLEHVFDFSSKNIVTIYAPNGVMKTSFAKVFKDVSLGNDSSDRIFTDRRTERIIKKDGSNEVLPEEILVIEPYNEDYKSEKISTLLVNKELKKEYEDIYKEIGSKKEELLGSLKKMSGFKKELEIEETLSQDISNKKDVFIALNRIKGEVEEYKNNVKGFEKIQYASIFNNESFALLKDGTILDSLEEYIKTYDKLIENSTFFKKGVFNHNNASEIARRLKENGWFKATHAVVINLKGTKQEISNEQELENAIEQEKNSIINDVELQQAFEKLDKDLVKNKARKEFRDYIQAHKDILTELKEPGALKEKLWIAYLSQAFAEYSNLLELYDKSKARLKEIAKKAEEESTQWQKVISEFNDRYSVPFKLRMANQSDVILSDAVPSIQFDFVERSENKPVDKELLLTVLSQGEKRALYILNIIFEVEARKEASQETIFVIDDIADSFDYKNKYAIIEYLKDISENQNFYMIILTHNFDFHRNASGRLGVSRPNRFIATKYSDEIKLEKEIYQKQNPFNEWKKFQSWNHIIASIPFVRNLAEFCGHDTEFEQLTHLLHQKQNTSSLSANDLANIFSKVITFNKSQIAAESTPVVIHIYASATTICNKTVEKLELEEKVILSMAIRLKLESFLIDKINNDDFVRKIEGNQTRKLSDKFAELYPQEFNAIDVIKRVNLMTPENIHLNSFMYEPILDMSNEHLKKLYSDVEALLAS